MGVIAWIVLGIVAGLVAERLVPGKGREGILTTCLIGIGGALLGGFLAVKLFHIDTVHGFFNISTWITAIIGAAVLLVAYHALTGQHSGRRSRRRVRRR